MARISVGILLAAAVLAFAACNNNLMTALNYKIALSETVPPTPGAKGVLTVGTERATVLPVSWEKGDDNVTSQGDLEYQVVYSQKDNIETVADAAEYGTVAVKWTADIGSADVTGLTVLTTYYVNVMLRDRAGNEAVYTSASATTTQDTLAPTPGGTASISVGSLAMDGFTVSWTAGSDDVTPADKLTYQAYTSTADNVSTAADALKNGTPFGSPVAGVTSIDVTGLNDAATYYVNIAVRDEADNLAAYNGSSATTVKHPRIFYTVTAAPDQAVWRAELDGTSPQAMVTSGFYLSANPFVVAVDPVDRKVYWADTAVDASSNGKIMRCDFDGSNVEEVITQNLKDPYGLAVDFTLPGRYLYWTDRSNNMVYRSPLPPTSTDAVDFELLNQADNGVLQPTGIDVDQNTGDFYWLQYAGDGYVRTASADTPTAITNIITTGSHTPIDIAVDYVGKIIYWTDHATNYVEQHKYTDNFEVSTNIITSNTAYPSGISVDPTTGDLFWMDSGTADAYRRHKTDVSTNANDFVIMGGLASPRGVQNY